MAKKGWKRTNPCQPLCKRSFEPNQDIYNWKNSFENDEQLESAKKLINRLSFKTIGLADFFENMLSLKKLGLAEFFYTYFFRIFSANSMNFYHSKTFFWANFYWADWPVKSHVTEYKNI